MAGFWGEQNDSSVPFVILKVSSNETGIAGMLDWEAALPHFFETIFSFNANIVNDKRLPVRFRDEVVRGRDARILSNSSSNTIAYAFVNSNTIVIAGSRSALESIIPLAGKI